MADDMYIHLPHNIIQTLRAELKDKEAKLRAREVEMHQRDAEICRLMEKLKRSQAQLQRYQVCLTNLFIVLTPLQYCIPLYRRASVLWGIQSSHHNGTRDNR